MEYNWEEINDGKLDCFYAYIMCMLHVISKALC